MTDFSAAIFLYYCARHLLVQQILQALNPDLERWYAGHFTGRFKDLKGDGRKMSFRVVDIYRVQNGQIFDNWHLEDNLSLTQQPGVVKP